MEPVGSGDGSGELIGIGSGELIGVGSGKRKGIGSGKRKGIRSGKRKGIGSGKREGIDIPQSMLRMLLFEVLQTRIKNQAFSLLRNIDDQDEKVNALREFEERIMRQHFGFSSLTVHIKRNDGLETWINCIAGAISNVMVAQFLKQEERACCALDSCSEAVNDLWEHFPRYEQNLTLLSKVQSVSAIIDLLRRLAPDLDHKLRLMEVEADVEETYLDCKLMALKIDEEKGKDIEAARMLVEGFDTYRSCWESSWCPARNFEDMTLASSMIFTHCTPGRIPRDAITGSTLQMYSIKLKVKEIQGFKEPLKVYGVVAARDTVDSSRNPIFLRPRHDCQILNLQDSFLHLIGPSRAIVSMAPIDFEINLKLKGASKSEDKTLISKVYHYNGERLGTYLINDVHCEVELCFQQLEHCVQATISRAQIVEKGLMPFPHGGRVVCFLLPHEESMEIVMIDTKGAKMSMGKHRCIDLYRRVVSVALGGRLKVTIEAYAPSGEIEITGHVLFTPQKCGITKDICHLGETAVEVTVAWSLLPSPKVSLPCPLPMDRTC